MSTKARYAAVLVALLVFLSVFIWSTLKEPAHAATSPCERTHEVTNHEWDQLHDGLTRAQVRKILDGDGKKGESQGVREYPVCNRPDTTAVIWYRNGGRILDGGFWLTVKYKA